MDDESIIELFFARNEKAITETEHKYGRLCFHIAMNILGNTEDAEECVNDAYLGMWNRIPPARPDNLMAFLCQVTRYLSFKKLDYNKAKKRSPDILVSFAELENVLPDSHIRPAAENEEIADKISEFLRQEKEDARNVFIRKYWFFDSVRDIAARYAFSESKVKNMLYHSRSRLKKFLKKEGIDI